MHPDDVKHALDALASEAPAPTGDASATVARGRRRLMQRRVTLIGVVAALVASVAIVGAVAHTQTDKNLVSSVPTTATKRNAPETTIGVASETNRFPSVLEAWKCGNPVQYTDDGGQTWRNIALPRGVTVEGNCAAIPGGDAWMTSSDGHHGLSHLVRIRGLTDIQFFGLPKIPRNEMLSPPTFVDANHGWLEIGPGPGARSLDSTLYRTVDGGATWSLAAKNEPLGQLSFVNADRGWSRYGGTFMTTTDGGISWRKVALPEPPASQASDVGWFQVEARGTTVVVWCGVHISGSRFRTYFDVSADDGTTWSLRRGPAGFEVPVPGANNVFGATDASHWQIVSGPDIRITDDAGLTWQTRPNLPLEKNGNVFPPIAFPNPNVGWITTSAGSILRTTDAGRTWVDVTRGQSSPSTPTATAPRPTPGTRVPYVPSINDPAVPLAATFPSASEGWLCGGQRLRYTADGGESWYDINIPSFPPRPPTFQEPLCAAIRGGEAWVLTATNDPYRPQIVRIEHGGGTEQTLSFPSINPPNGSSPSGLDNGNKVGFVEATPVITDLTFSDSQHGWALSSDGSGTARDLYATINGGADWKIVDHAPPLDAHSADMRFVSPTDGWALGTAPSGTSALVRTIDGGHTWDTVVDLTPTAQRVPSRTPSFTGLAVAPAAIIASGDVPIGKVTTPFFDVSTDGGRTWLTRSGPTDQKFAHTAGGLTAGTALNAIDANHWQFSSANDLYTTEDGGRTWTQVAEFAGLGSVTDVAFPTPQVGVVTASGALQAGTSVALETSDGGATWRNVDEVAPEWLTGTDASFPGGLVGCPTRPLTPAPPGNPPPGLVEAAIANVRAVRGWKRETVVRVYPVGADPPNSSASVFNDGVGTCGTAVANQTWVVELKGQPPASSLASSPAQLALAHYADGWHVFGHYH